MPKLLYRLGIFSSRHRLLVTVSWAILFVVVGVTALTGMKLASGGFEIPGAESSKALEVVEEEFPQGSAEGDGTLQLVVQANDVTSPKHSLFIMEAVDAVKALDHVRSVSNPLDPAAPYISRDLSTAVVQVEYTGVTEENSGDVKEALGDIAQSLRDDGLTAEVGGSFGTEVPEILGPTEIVGALIAFLVLFLTFGSLVAAGANMLGALVGVGVGVLGVLAFSAVTPIQSTTPILAVMLGLAVGIDYCLFILARFRAELKAGRDVDTAIGRAIGTAGTSVTFAGLTVIIALAGLAVVNIPFITEMGVAAACAVAVAVLMALTLLPVLMKTMGRRALSRKDRTALTRRSSTVAPVNDRIGFLERWASFVVHKPLRSVIGSVIVLGIVAIPFLSMQTALSTPGGEDPASSQRAAYDIVADEFGAGAQSPLVVLVESHGNNVESELPKVESVLADLDDVATVVPGTINETGDAAIVTVLPESGPVDQSTLDLVQNIRDNTSNISGLDVSVTGETAIGLDVDNQLSSALVKYLFVVVGLSLILLIVMFRSLLVPLVATAGFLLSLGAGIGATVAVFQWGWLDFAVSAPQGNPLLSLLPIILTGILFGLAMDYQVFLVSRMHEAYSRGLPPKEAILDGFSKSAVVVVAAAAIMTAVFGGFALSPSSFVASIALGLTVGVIADAFIVRMIVVPAALSLFGRAAWWIPAWLDRVLPRVDTEGHSLDEDQERQGSVARAGRSR